MTTALQALESIKKLLEEKVASKMKFQKEKSDPAEYVHPYVTILNLPHKNFTPYDFQVPYIMIGMNPETDGANEHSIEVIIQFGLYGGANYDRNSKIPDNKATIDLLNLIDHCKLELVKNTVIEGGGSIDKPLISGIYNEELTYPYAYGYLTFKAQLALNEYTMHDDMLLDF